MASPTAASTAATTITKNAIRWPLIDLFWYENVTKLRFTAFSISSMDMNTVITLRRNTKPATPNTNRMALSVRNQEIGTGMSVMSVHLLPRQDNGAHDADQDQDGGRLERQQVGGEQRAADIERRAVPEAAENHRGASRV